MWTEKNEKEWERLTKQREENKKEVGKQQTIKMLQDMIKSLELGKEDPYEIQIDYIRGEEMFASDLPAPVIGKKITLIFRKQ